MEAGTKSTSVKEEPEIIEIVPIKTKQAKFKKENQEEQHKWGTRMQFAKACSHSKNGCLAQDRAKRLRGDIEQDFEESDADAEASTFDGSMESEKSVHFAPSTYVNPCANATYLQSSLSGSHELCLNTFVSRVDWSRSFDHAFNEKEALMRARNLCLEIQELEMSDEDQVFSGEAKPWIVTSDAMDEAIQKKKIKSCFWILEGESKIRGREGELQRDEEQTTAIPTTPVVPAAPSAPRQQRSAPRPVRCFQQKA
eukprot:TRINITY_DN50173_c0_g1_i1.p1 TRINITY_DN50173_c0_g1~~TRINITY_DN50173_c0_g1_i1.p1  ORF type:complete len:254 (+),score=77.46 TRINITY_DN50173_c0_g1_i1:81-842(+)